MDFERILFYFPSRPSCPVQFQLLTFNLSLNGPQSPFCCAFFENSSFCLPISQRSGRNLGSLFYLAPGRNRYFVFCFQWLPIFAFFTLSGTHCAWVGFRGSTVRQSVMVNYPQICTTKQHNWEQLTLFWVVHFEEFSEKLCQRQGLLTFNQSNVVK